jgi:bleomycin hydrolase
MTAMRRSCPIVMAGVMMCAMASAQQAQRDTVTYVPHESYPVIDEMEERNEQLAEEAAKKTEEILKRITEQKERQDKERPKLRFDLGHIVRPAGPDDFTSLWHFPPTPQYLTGTCWSFSATSFLESEIKRISGQEIKLSEMWSAYWEYVEKARGWVASRGETAFEEGSQSAAVMRVMRQHGLVPRADYEGVLAADGRFDHSLMHSHMLEFLRWCREAGFWDEEVIEATIRLILDRSMGRPPEVVSWDGIEYSPGDFMTRICQLDPDDYVDLMSTLSEPMWQRGEYRVPDNWWHDSSYVNVPLDVWYDTIRSSLAAGYSLVIGGDVSEPGLYGPEDIAVVPTFDIPGNYIDQSAREFRFANGSTADDHGIHLVGHTVVDGHDWFLIKDSNRSSRKGTFKGYYMYRDDYVRLKMLTITVHRDVIPEILERLDGSEEAMQE